MQSFLDFFEFMPVWQKALWIFGVLTFFWILEGYYAFRETSSEQVAQVEYNKWKHAKTNFAFLAFVMIINVVFGLATAGVFIWLETSQFGLLHLLEGPVWVEILLSILVLDLIAQYGVHYLLHKVKWMWRLHLIHHSDTHLDATSGTRHHPLDFVIRELFALGAVVIMGMPLSYYFFYRILTVAFTYWTHANIRIPDKIDRALSWIIVTPTMHKFHHHHEMPWTDTNYGNMLSIWDRMFGTFLYDDPDKIVYGLDLVDNKRSDDLKYQLGLPFDKRVEYKD
ncbi:fatty acid hydroxylase family protein [Dokdonia sinensis]|uniref:Fatty acid hydroxylase family protein n=1 Tax=Dokdonia sinensis TaxID=2479847 RepID=A0A3M0GEA4_9FLAO|nr:sterol desaturase family protein [Dokdonia sinensis]RMB63225.1 fatty acid hydroxylase family protein [Dokdonia sinensis]